MDISSSTLLYGIMRQGIMGHLMNKWVTIQSLTTEFTQQLPRHKVLEVINISLNALLYLLWDTIIYSTAAISPKGNNI